jgi:GT2 family glycosyltransferase
MNEPTTVESGGDRQDVETSLREEVENLGRIVDQQERTIASLSREVDLHAKAIGWRLQQRLIPVRTRMLAVPVLRQIYRALYRVLEIWVDEGFWKIFSRAGDKVNLALRGRNFLVEGADRRAPRIEDQYEQWMALYGAPPSQGEMLAAIGRFGQRPLISVLVCLETADTGRARRLLASLQGQSYDRWELCLTVPPGSPALNADLQRAVASEPRVRTITGVEPESTHVEALRAASGEFIGIMNAADELAAEALFELVKRLNEEDADIVYSDEDWLSETGRREDPLFKPDWGPDLLLSTNYLERFGIFRRELVAEVGGFRAAAGRGQVYDLVLRLTERTDRIAHVPKVLYHNRRQPTTVDTALARHAANRDEARVLVEALHRRGIHARASALFARKGPRGYATRWDLRQRPLVSIIIPTRNKRALLQTTLESIWSRTDYDRYEIIIINNDTTETDAVEYLASLPPRCQVHQWSKPFNYSGLNNFGVQHSRGEQLLFLNNDVEVIQPDWLTAMLEHAQRSEVGVVGARLLYDDGRIQHAGVVVGINRVAANAFRSWPGQTIGNLRLADLTRNCSAVTGACMMVSRRIFDDVGGFDEGLRVVLNDVDLCLKIRQRGYLVVYTPHACLYHYEGSSRGRLHPPPDEKVFEQRWKDFLDRGDPYYNPNLSARYDDWRIKTQEDKEREDAQTT